MNRARSSSGLFFILPALLVLLVAIVFPVVCIVLFSFEHVTLGASLFGSFAGLDNYSDALTSVDLGGSLWRTLGITTLSVTATVVIGFLVAVLLNRPFRGRTVARSLVVLPWAMPTFACAFAWRWMLDYNYGAINQTLEGIGLHRIPFLADSTMAFLIAVVIYIWKELPWAVLVMLAGLQSVPMELREAARVDGASPRREYLHVVIPSMTYVIQIVALLLFIWEFTWFDMMWLLTNGGPGTATMVLPITIYREAFYAFNMGTASAIATVMLVVLLGVAVLYMRTWREEEASV